MTLATPRFSSYAQSILVISIFCHGLHAFAHAEAPVSCCLILQEVQGVCRGQPGAQDTEIGRAGAQMPAQRPGTDKKAGQAGELVFLSLRSKPPTLPAVMNAYMLLMLWARRVLG